jgi:iron complex outermembrane receptor protein
LCAGVSALAHAQSSGTAVAPAAVKVLETMVVTATRVPEPAMNLPSAVTVLDRLHIATSPAGNVGDLLRGVPGLNVIQTSTRDVTLRARGAVGVAETSQLALLDGRSLYLDYYGIVVWDYLPVAFDEIERVEVLRGPGSVMWGANALNGVVNFITRSPRNLVGGLATIGFGEHGSRSASLRWAGVQGAFSYKISGSWYEQNPWPRTPTLPDGSPLPFGYDYTNQGTEQPKLDLRVDWDPARDQTWSFRTGFGGTTGIFQSPIGPFVLEQGAHVAYGSAAYHNSTTDARVYWNQLRGDAPNALSGLPFSFALDTYVGEATHRLQFGGKHRLVFGGELRSNRFDLSIAPLDHLRNQVGGFAEAQFDFNTWALYAGGRLDWFDTLGTTLSPRLSVLFHPRPAQTLRVTYGQSYRAPSLVDNNLQASIPTVVPLGPTLPPFVYFIAAQGNPQLHEERARSVELSYGLILGSGWTLSATAYEQQVRNKINFRPITFFGPGNPPPGWPLPPALVPALTLPATYSFVNLGEVRDRGLELAAEFEWREGVRSTLSYTWQQRPRVRAPAGLLLTVNEPPRHQAHASLTADRGGRWFGSTALSYTDRAYWADVLDARFWGTTKSHLLLNAALGVRLLDRRVELVLKGSNLLNQRVQQHIFGDIIGRRSELELRYRF